jgi:tetratricopeptide (TPR) repeat protein
LEDGGSEKIGGDVILMSLGNCYLGMDDYERAAASYRTLIKSMPDSHRVVSAYLLLAKSLQNLGKSGEAKESYQKVIKDYPRSIEAHQAREHLNSFPLTQSSRVEAQPAMPEATQTASYFSIQVGAVSQRSNAEKLASRLRKNGYPVSIILPSPGGSSLYKVRIGNFRTRDAALEMAQQLGEKEKLDTEIFPQ